MNTLIDSPEGWLSAALTLSWKGALLAVAAGLALLLIRKRLSPAWRHGLWLLVLLRFVMPDVGTSSLSMDRLTRQTAMIPLETEPRAEVESLVSPPAVLETASDMPPLPAFVGQPEVLPDLPQPEPAWTLQQKMTLAWLAGIALVLAVMTFMHVRLLWRLRRDAGEPPAQLAALLQDASAQAGIRRTPRLIVSDAVRSPALFGILRPAILLPSELAKTHDTAALRLILLHEIAHLQRRDLWAQLIASLIVAVHWFNPVVWWAARRMRAEAEMAADARALRSTDVAEAHRLGEMLLGFASRATAGWMAWFAAATLLGISENKGDLRHRIEALMDIARGRRTRWVAGLAAFSVLAVFGLTRAPAQQAEVPPAAKANPNPASMITVTGIVVDSAGKPVEGAAVRLSVSLVSMPSGPQDQKTGPDGRFQFKPVLKAASLNLGAKHPDYAESGKLVFKGYSPNEERRLVLPDITWVVGKITDKKNGQPVKNARVFFGLERNLSFQSRYKWTYPTVRTSATGEYRLPIAVRNAETIIIRAWHPGMMSHAERLKITGKETPFDAQLEPAEKIAGKVIRADGQPVEGAFVWVAEDEVRLDEVNHPVTMDFLKSSQRSRLAEAKVQFLQDYSEADGGFELETVDPLLKEHFWIVAIHPEGGFARMQAKDFQAGSVLKLMPWASMSGRLVDRNGDPVADTSASIWAGWNKEILKPQPDNFYASQNLQFKTGKDGHFQIDRLLPGSTFNSVTISKEYRPIEAVTVGSGVQPDQTIRVSDRRRVADESEKRSIQGRIVLPKGQGFRSEAYSLFLFITSNGRTMPGGYPQPDAEGRFMTEPLPVGDYELKLSIHSRNPKLRTPIDSGRWMQFKLEPDAGQAPMDVGDIRLEEEDFAFKAHQAAPPAGKSTIRLDIPITQPAATWSASGFGTAFADRQPLSEGRIVGELSVTPEKPFLLQVATAGGAVFFSQPLFAGKDSGAVIKTGLTLSPGVILEGKIQDLPASEDGSGWVAAQVMVKPDASPKQVFKGHPSPIQWVSWAPVTREGRFRFSGLPGGEVMFSGLGKGWVTKFSFRADGDHRLVLDGSETQREVTLQAQPCLEQPVRLLLFDGRPAAGAKLKASFFDPTNIHLLSVLLATNRHAEDAEKYAAFQKGGWLGQHAEADADGRVTLINQPPGETTFEVSWTDSKTGKAHQDRVKLKIGSSEVQEVMLVPRQP